MNEARGCLIIGVEPVAPALRFDLENNKRVGKRHSLVECICQALSASLECTWGMPDYRSQPINAFPPPAAFTISIDIARHAICWQGRVST